MSRKLGLFALLAGLAVFYCTTLRSGHLWGDDFALYVSHARNIAVGQPYAQTGYIYNPDVVNYSPRAYPPIFPLLLVPSYKLFGLNLIPMKIEEVLFLVLALLLIYLYWERDLEYPYLLALIAILGLNPRFWSDKDNVLSDYPFLFFFYLAAFLVRFAPRNTKRWWSWALLVGFVLYLCAGTRTVGLTLIPGLLLYDLAKQRRVTAFTAIAAGICGALLLAQAYVTGGGESSYLHDYSLTLRQSLLHVKMYTQIVGAFWLGSSRSLFAFGVLGVVSVLTAMGAYFLAKRGFTVVEAFLLPYVLVVVTWPSRPGLRFMFPVIPFCVVLALVGLGRLTAGWPRRYAGTALAALLLLVGIGYATTYRNIDFGPIRETDGSATFNELCLNIRTSTTPGTAFICRRPRALALYTPRAASVYQTTGDADLWRYMGKMHATYIVTSEMFDTDRAFLIPFVQRYPANLALVFENADFRLYRVRSYADFAGKAENAEPPR